MVTPDFMAVSLDQLENADPSQEWIERRCNYDITPDSVATEYRTAASADSQYFDAKMARLEALSAEMDLKFAYLLED